MDYQFGAIEKKWQQHWKDSGAYRVPNESSKPKYYVLDMFPYPSGAGLHVGHPLGYIASDIFSRYKRQKGFNVLHPMGYDAFGLPAEQYALEHGVHPAVSTEQNIANFRRQLDNLGFCFDWEREVRTSDPKYYKWTQWIFLQLFHSWFDRHQQKARPIGDLIAAFETEGNARHDMPDARFVLEGFSSRSPEKFAFEAGDWAAFSEKQRQDILMEYRLAYCGYGEVNWCEALGTVLANDEVVNGVSERGGHPVVRKKLRQWYLRITEYADRLLEGLQRIDFSEAMKEMQTNWIGKSYGAEITFTLSLPSPPGGEAGRSVNDSAEGRYYKVSSHLQFEFARRMRKQPTPAEDALWQALRNRQLGYKFRRQHPIENFIADFALLEVGLIVEVDGGYHADEAQLAYDKERAERLSQLGFHTIRFNNEEVLGNIEAVLEKIRAHADDLKARQPDSAKKAAPASPHRGEAGARGLKVYTTRPDTIFGVDFMVLAPEHELVQQITTDAQRAEVATYLDYVNSRSERERQAEKKITGCFTGAYVVHPFDGRPIPVWISEYVLAGYGTGAIMAVPCGDERDHKFARHFGIPITNIIGDAYNGEEANPTKDAILQNSGFLDGMVMRDAIGVVIDKIEEMGIGRRQVNYKMRDAAFSRQRYWGEPFPIVWQDGIATPLDESELPLELPHVDSYEPGPEGEGPLANIPEWTARRLETNTMPGYAGSSWYFLRYMDPHNEAVFASRQATDYWNQVDLYVGGTEHAVGHLLYSRMWTKALYDLGHISFDEPYRKLLNQGMIQGSSRFVYRINGTQTYVSAGLVDTEGLYNGRQTDKLHVDVNLVDGVQLDVDAFRKWKPDFADAEFVLEDGKYICASEVEKMSKSKFNTVNPDDIVARYGADTFRMYEMFLGPVELSKPWDTKGIEGVHRFLKKFWRLFYDEQQGAIWTDEKPTDAEWKVLHRTIKKIEDDTERFSFNTAVSTFMIAVNELTDLRCHKREILEPLTVLLAPYAPHIAEELWHQLGNNGLVIDAAYPQFDPSKVVESTKEYPVSINGKVRTTLSLPAEATQEEIQPVVLDNEVVKKWMDGKPLKKFIFVKGRMINLVV